MRASPSPPPASPLAKTKAPLTAGKARRLAPFALLVPRPKAPPGPAPAKPREAPRATPAHVQSRRPEVQPEDDERDRRKLDPLDPACRSTAQLAPPMATPPTQAIAAPPTEPSRAYRSIEELLPQLVRRVAWAGNGKKGTVQLELGAGPHAGTTVTVHANEGRVRVELEGAGADALRSRIDARLRAHGLDVETG